jgi:Cellulase (glycosyl hydrolase family 5)
MQAVRTTLLTLVFIAASSPIALPVNRTMALLSPASAAVAGGGWSTSGPRILTPTGNEYIIAGANWFGAETRNYAPHGMWSRDYKFLLDQFKSLGFNTIRLPYSDENWRINPKVSKNIIGACPECQGKRTRDVLALIVNYAGAIGLHIIMDNHRSSAGSNTESATWYTSSFPEQVWIENWLSILRWSHGIPQTFGAPDTITANYLASDGFPTIIGFDLRNEPHTDCSRRECDYLGGGTWGAGDGIDPTVNPNPNPFTPSCVATSTCHDWRLAAERCADTILGEALNNGWDYPLMFVEGVQAFPIDGGTHASGPYQFTNWGGNLIGVNGTSATPGAPIVLNAGGNATSLGPPVNNKLVYSVHDYGPLIDNNPNWFNSGTCYRDGCNPNRLSSLAGRWRYIWAYVNLAGGINPVWPGHAAYPWANTGHTGYSQAPLHIGEFGTGNQDTDLYNTSPGTDGQWFTGIVNFIASSYNRTATNDPGYALTSVHWTYWAYNANSGGTGILGDGWNTVGNPKKVYTFLCSIEKPPFALPFGAGSGQCGSTGPLPNPF